MAVQNITGRFIFVFCFWLLNILSVQGLQAVPRDLFGRSGERCRRRLFRLDHMADMIPAGIVEVSMLFS